MWIKERMRKKVHEMWKIWLIICTSRGPQIIPSLSKLPKRARIGSELISIQYNTYDINLAAAVVLLLFF